MNKKQARTILLEQGLEQARNTIQFLHECLVHPARAKYAYPKHTADFIAEIDALIEREPGCGHSITKKGCLSCQRRVKWRRDRFNARVALGLEKKGLEG